MNELTQKELKELFKYDPETGHFTRIISRRGARVGDIAGSPDTAGYILIKINYKKYLAHRLVFLYMTGKLPEKGLQVDHLNHKKDDNRWINLRLVTNQENMKNRTINKNNPSGHTGVYLHKVTKNWIALIRVNGKLKHLGYFDNKDDAVKARKEAEIKYGFHNNHGKKN